MSSDQSFVKTGHGYKVEVTTHFDFENSNPLQFQYLFKYTILISNTGGIPAQLLSRKWNIRDAKGVIRVVEGPGVVGNTPQFEVGAEFEYSSFCPIETMTGEMWGHFNMMDKNGHAFTIETPTFYFKVPEDFIDRY